MNTASSLEVSLERCTVSHCGTFGVSVDLGTRAVFRQCVFEDNDPSAIFVKGASDASITACRIRFKGARSKCAPAPVSPGWR